MVKVVIDMPQLLIKIQQKQNDSQLLLKMIVKKNSCLALCLIISAVSFCSKDFAVKIFIVQILRASWEETATDFTPQKLVNESESWSGDCATRWSSGQLRHLQRGNTVIGDELNNT